MSSGKRRKAGEDHGGSAGKGKRRRLTVQSSEDEDDVAQGAGKFADNAGRSQGDKRSTPAELFRKDLISAMKMPDSEPLLMEEYILISDPWRQDWEKGVQVPVNPEVSNQFQTVLKVLSPPDKSGPFKLPDKLVQIHDDLERFTPSRHELSDVNEQADKVCRYDLDDLDVSWLERYNEDRVDMGQSPIPEYMIETIIEELETKCYENMQHIKKTSIGMGIEYDENTACNVCQTRESEDGNEMVFCDGCDVCVHQECYGIQNIPAGKWYCRTCSLAIQPQCELCPKKGGAMKPTRSGQKWAHVSCALWIPEVSIGDAERMEPVTKIKDIKPTRWNLVCCLCRNRQGACIQCSVKTCKTAFHVTCAFEHKLDMRTEVVNRDEDDDEEGQDVLQQSYCPKHTQLRRADPSLASPKKQADQDLTEQEKEDARAKKLSELENRFYTCVTVDQVAKAVNFDLELVSFVYEYWVLKRRSNFNNPLLAPKEEEEDMLTKQQEGSLIARQKMFITLRQDLEKVRNACYMISRREKLRRLFYKTREYVFRKQLQVIQSMHLSSSDMRIVIDANHSDTIYDNPQLWHFDTTEDDSQSQISQLSSADSDDAEESKPKSRTERVLFPQRTAEEVKPSNPWLISKALQDKVHSKIFRTKKPKAYVNGLADRTQKKLEYFFKPLTRQAKQRSLSPVILYGSCNNRIYQDVDHEVSICMDGKRLDEKENMSDEEIDVVNDSTLYPKVSDQFPMRVTRSRLTHNLGKIWNSVEGLA